MWVGAACTSVQRETIQFRWTSQQHRRTERCVRRVYVRVGRGSVSVELYYDSLT